MYSRSFDSAMSLDMLGSMGVTQYSASLAALAAARCGIPPPNTCPLIERRRRYHLQVVARGERDNFFSRMNCLMLSTSPSTACCSWSRRGCSSDILCRTSPMILFLAIAAGQVGMASVVRIHLCVHWQRQRQHFRADRLYTRSPHLPALFGVDRGLHHQPEFRIVKLFAQPPCATWMAAFPGHP